jgi:hypothetical protein
VTDLGSESVNEPSFAALSSLLLGLQGAASPDAIEHLLNAASELIAAARAALDAADAVVESQREAHARRAQGRAPRVERIHVRDA